MDPTRPTSIKNSAYIHKMCEASDFQIVRTMEDTSILRPYDTYTILEGLSIYDPEEPEKRKPITPSWRHYKLKEYFAQHTEASITLTFQEVETIEKRPLPSSARKDRHFWYHRKTENGIAEAWRTEGYSLKRLDMGKEKITFHRDAVGASKLVIPAILMNGKLPDNAVYELERHMEYIINKYGLIE